MVHQDIPATRRVVGPSQVDHHIIDADLAFPSTLLRCHRSMMARLIHSILVCSSRMLHSHSLSSLALSILGLRIGILHDFVHVNLVPNRWR